MGIFSDTCVVFLCGFLWFCSFLCCFLRHSRRWCYVPAMGAGVCGMLRSGGVSSSQRASAFGVLCCFFLPVCADVRAVFARVPGCAGLFLLWPAVFCGSPLTSGLRGSVRS